MNNKFLENSTLITYSPSHVTNVRCDNLKSLIFDPRSDDVYWLNTYGLTELEDIKKVIIQNNLDDFLLKLFQEKEHVNKVIELDNVLFIAIKVLMTEGNSLKSEQMIFVVSANMLWSLQEEKGTYFEWIRERLTQGKGLVRSKKVDYLMFLIIESMVSSYESTFENIINNDDDFLNVSNIQLTPYFTEKVEQQKMRLLN